MNREWDLTPLYRGFDTEEYRADREALAAVVAEYVDFVARLPEEDRGPAIRRALTLQEKLAWLARRQYDYAGLRAAVNTTDTEALDASSHLRKLLAETSAADAIFLAYVGRTENLEALIAADDYLSEYAYLLRNRKADAKYVLDEKVEEVLAKLNLSGGAAWENLQSYLTSTVRVVYRGEVIPYPAVRNLAYDPDPAVRRDAYDAELACYEAIKDAISFALNSLKQQVNTVCELRGAGSPLEMTLRESRMQRSTLDAMLQAVEEALPVFWKYLRAKAKLLGYEGGLKWWDLFAPLGRNTASYTVEEARDYLIAHFRPFAPEMAVMIERAFREGWIDFTPRTGKVGGAFCAAVPSIRQSRVLTNFDGAFSDIVTLAHELGHAYHDMMTMHHRILNQDYTMPVAETASTFNETVIMNAALAEADDPAVKLGLLDTQLQDTTQIMCDIMSRYWFETAVFEKAKTGFAFPEELCQMMKAAQQRAYGDGLDPETLNQYMWIGKSHYYSAGLSFYNFPYAFGGLFAAGLYARYRAEGAAFVPKFRALLRATPVASVEDVAAMAGIDLGDVGFWRSSMEIFKDRVEQFLELAGFVNRDQ